MKLPLPTNCHLRAFADDALLLAEAETLEDLQSSTNEALRLFADWADSVKLTANERKTQAMFIRKSRDAELQLEMKGERLQVVESMKYLGVVVDSKLSWRPHFDYIEKKVRKIYFRMAKIARNTWGISTDVCAQIYRAVIEPILL